MKQSLRTGWKMLPDGLVCVSALWLLYKGENADSASVDALGVIMFLEFAMWIAGASLVDIASNLERKPSVYLAVFIIAGLALLNWQLFPAVHAAWLGGFGILLPFLWSLLERVRELWTLPDADRIDKVRSRILTFDRLYVGVLMGWCALAAGLINAWQNDGSMAQGFAGRALPWFVLVFFLIATFNIWRVRQARFVAAPKSLLPFIDRGDGNDARSG